MRYITADYIFPISSAPIKNGVVILNEDDKIMGLETSNLKLPTSNIEQYEGIICPGFINAHCHLELSHMKGMIAENLGMAGFIKEMLTKRNAVSAEKISEAIVGADEQMYNNGIVGVGDISNGNVSLFQKSNSKINYHTFFEVFDLNPDKATQVYSNAQQLQKEYFEKMKMSGAYNSSSLVPHAPYSVSEKLFGLIASQKPQTLISYHNQESIAESELYINKKGAIAELFSSMGINLDYIKSNGKNSLQSTLPFLSNEHKLLFVHNTYTAQADIEHLKSKISNPTLSTQHSALFFCLCPNANLYIEGRLPDIDLFVNEKCNVVVGTDSLASNHSLSVLDELKTIAEKFPSLSLQTLLTWATKNGAEYFGWENVLGTIEPDKTPGIVLIKNVDVAQLRLTEASVATRLL